MQRQPALLAAERESSFLPQYMSKKARFWFSFYPNWVTGVKHSGRGDSLEKTLHAIYLTWQMEEEKFVPTVRCGSLVGV